ncbi:hypothetical protein ILUMI_01549 [Ignelater luminosus]|uniref:Peptidase S1 domain-containing protein n=1 Tax=Ignelater luminosus TaxID=2038154 RepID=A0A8K0DJS9_IGNLU|nr:hypothetical protein ILUMI_01549 [Ignelater luminosus]
MGRSLILFSLLCFSGLVVATSKEIRIVGGKDAADGAYPHQVSLLKRGDHSCGGSIIHSEWVVTAASCVHQQPESSLTVLAGTNRLSGGGTLHRVLASYVHPKYNPDTYDNNVAVLRVQLINFNPKTRKIELERSPVSENEFLMVTGWGFTSSPPTSNPDNLKELGLLTLNTKVCSSLLNRPIPPGQFCTLPSFGEGTCAGDTGGPLTNPYRRLAGVAQAFNYPCGVGLPDVHLEISNYYQWINDQCNCL